MRTLVLHGRKQNEDGTYDVCSVFADARWLTAESHGCGGQYDLCPLRDPRVVAGLANGQTDQGGRVVTK